LVSHIKGRIQIEGVSEQGGGDNIWTYMRGCDRSVRKVSNKGLPDLYSSSNITEMSKSEDEMGRICCMHGRDNKSKT
jgi:hypothetical protein